MKIGTLAQATGCTVETIRYYEKEGLLPAPQRTSSNYRAYSGLHLERLRFIRNCRTLGMSHGEIRALLGLVDQPGGDCGGVNQLLDAHIAHVDERIAELLHLKQQLEALRQCCQHLQPIESCGILQGLASMEPDSKSSRRTHLG